MELNYENKIIKKLFINILLKKGKKVKSEKIIKYLLINIKKKTNKNPNKILTLFIKNLSPRIKYIEINKKKRQNKKKWKQKKSLYFFFYLIRDKQIKISIKWLFYKNKKIIYSNIIKDILQTTKKKGLLINKKKNYYKEIKKLKFFF